MTDRDTWVALYTAAQDAGMPQAEIDAWNARYDGCDVETEAW